MAPAFSSDIIARIKDETDISDVVRRHVSLKPAGSVFKGLCPFHKEKTPSFIVTPSKGRWHCFGCGEGGDVFSFVMQAEGISFPEAVEVLARPLDIDLSASLVTDEAEGERRAFHRANEAAMTLWKDALWNSAEGQQGLAYLTGRGFSEKVIRDFDLGWAPRDSRWLEAKLAEAGVDLDLAVRSDLLRQSDRGDGVFAYFRNRIIFPIKNISRQIVGFGGRVLDQGEPKYLNSADSSYFSKGRLLYGFDAARMPIAREKTAMLVEGYLDLLALAQAGYHNVVATCGTAFTADQAKLIRRGAETVLLVFDGDKAGLKAAVRSADMSLKMGLEPRIVTLPNGQDPADVVTEGGPEAMQPILQAARGYIPYLKDLADAKGAGREVLERALRQAMGTIAGIGDSLKREYVLQEAAEVFGLPADLLRENMAKMVADNRPPTPVRRETGTGSAPAPTPPPEPEAAPVRRSGPRVKRRMGGVRAPLIEDEMLAHILQDAGGKAARTFDRLRGELEFTQPGSRLLATELAAWLEQTESDPNLSPGDFILARWNEIGDGQYRAYISMLLDREVSPATTDFTQVIQDCLSRLKQGQRSGSG